MLRELRTAFCSEFLAHTALTHAAQRIRRLRFARRWARIRIHQFLDGNRDFRAKFARKRAGRRIESHEHELHEDLRINDDSRAFRGTNACLVLGKTLAKFFVRRVFVTEAAHQASAATGDLQRIERRLLDLRRAHRNRLENLQEVLAAAVLTAALVVGDESRFVACANLTHLDTALVGAREFLREIAEINAFVGQVVHKQQRFIEREFEINDFRGEFALRSDGTNAWQFRARLVGARRRAIDVVD